MNPTRIRRLGTEVPRASRSQIRLEQAHSEIAGPHPYRTVPHSYAEHPPIVPRADLFGRANTALIRSSVAHAALAC